MSKHPETSFQELFDKASNEEGCVLIHKELKNGRDFDEVARFVTANAYANLLAVLRTLPADERYTVACQLLGELSQATLNWAGRTAR